MKLTIDRQELECQEPINLVEAAKRLQIEIPTLCYKSGYEHFTSCMLCVVKDCKTGRLIPACSTQAAEGMEIETGCEEVREARKTTLELLLSEHVGDCEAPCQRLCPLNVEIPAVLRAIRDGRTDEAIDLIRAEMALPSVLERLCHAPCEKGCRRSQHDAALNIRGLMRRMADRQMQKANPKRPNRAAHTGKRIAIVGAGATGLAAAYYLQLSGHGCVVHEATEQVGGLLLEEVVQGAVPSWALEGELNMLLGLGVFFEFHSRIGDELRLPDLCRQFDAVLLACGQTDFAFLQADGVDLKNGCVAADSKTGQTSRAAVFAAGSAVKAKQLLLKKIAQAKQLAVSIDQFLKGRPVTGAPERYHHTMGRLLDGELQVFLENANPRPRTEIGADVSLEEAGEEADRCLHCDCRASHDCRLREYCEEYGAKQSQFRGESREPFVHVNQNADAVYEPGKCVKCGLCVRITRKEGEPLGFAFIGRGFHARPGVPLNKSLRDGLIKVARQVIDACPTGALADNEKKREDSGSH